MSTQPQALATQADQKALTQRKTLKFMITEDNFKAAVKSALPRHLDADRFIRISITALTRTPKLQQCTPESFFRCLLDLSALGLEPDGRRAHLIPYGNECTLVVDYKGLVELVRRSGEISYIHADVVYEGDEFDYSYGSGAALKHRPDLTGERKNRRAVYCFVKMKDGSEDFMVWGMSQVEAIRKRSKSANNGPWVTDFDEMAKKSVFRNQSKWLPFSPELRDKIERDDDQIAVDASAFEITEGGAAQPEDTGLKARVKRGTRAASTTATPEPPNDAATSDSDEPPLFKES